MPLKNKWVDKKDEVDAVVAEDINSIATAVIELEESVGDISLALDELHSYAETLVQGR